MMAERRPDMAGRARFPVVVFDLDGTLLRGTSVSLYLAERIGRGEPVAELERRFRAHEISNRVVADTTAAWFAGRDRAAVWEELAGAPWISGLDETMAALTAAGSRLLLATVTWRFAGEALRRRCGFDAACGTGMHAPGGLLSGRVSRYFDDADKVRFVERWCARHDVDMRAVAAVGDSRSDVPLFRRVGMAIALNATEEARAVAARAIDSDDLRDLLPLLLEA
jgi:phosphoserine phosphatase